MTETASEERESVLLRLRSFVAREPFALILALVVFFRPWRDGMTYPVFNFYFCWVLFVLGVGWGVHRFYTGRPFRFVLPTALFAAYLLVALFGLAGTYQVDATYRALIYWAGHFLLFFLCLNGIRSRTGIGLVLGAFVISSFANAVWSIVHLKYVLPTMREQLLTNPDAAYFYFRMREVPAELQHRLDMNRAFGTLLQPNALAGFMIIGIPYLLGESVNTLRYWLGRAALERNRAARGEALGVGIAMGLVVLILSRSIYPYLLGVITQDPNWRSYIALNWLFFVILPIGIGLFTFLLSQRYGFHALRMGVQTIALPSAFAVQLIVLFLTFSRGGLLALAAAMALAIALYAAGDTGMMPRLGGKKAAAAAMLVLLIVVGVTGSASWAQPAPELAAPGNDPRVEGQDVAATDLLSTSTLRLRLTYWKVGAIMARDNFWHGVGLGNFGTAYANYQYRGAGEVQAAHNVLIQTLSETGVFGLILFAGFWIYFLVWGGRRIVRDGDWGVRAALCGLYGGVAAFLIHSLLDFNFVNPALAAMVFAMAALFYVRAGVDDSEPASSKPGRGHAAVSIAVILVSAVGLGASLRPYIVELGLTTGDWKSKVVKVGDRKRLGDRVEVARYLLQELPQHPADAARLPYRWYHDVALIVPERELLESFGRIYAYDPKNPEASRPLARDEEPGRLAILQIHDIARARELALDKSIYWLSRFGRLDETYPHIADVAMKMSEWYRLLEGSVPDRGAKAKYADSALDWARKGAERSPKQAWFHSNYGRALWMRAAYTPWPGNIEYYERGLAEYRLSRDLYSISPVAWRQYASAAEKFGTALVSTGTDRARGERLIATGKEAAARATELEAPLRSD